MVETAGCQELRICLGHKRRGVHREKVQAKAGSKGSAVGRPEWVLGPQGAKGSSIRQLDSSWGYRADCSGAHQSRGHLDLIRKEETEGCKKLHPPSRCKTTHPL